MNIENKLVMSVISGLKALYGQDVPAVQVQLQKTKKEFEGHLTLVVFPFLRISKNLLLSKHWLLSPDIRWACFVPVPMLPALLLPTL